MNAKEIKNFKLSELLATETGLENFPSTFVELENILQTAKRLQTIRETFGRAIRVNSAYRSKQVNAKVGGASTSKHLQGLAADICAYSGKESDNRALYALLESKLTEWQIDQLILYTKKAGDKASTIRFMHVGWTEGKARGMKMEK